MRFGSLLRSKSYHKPFLDQKLDFVGKISVRAQGQLSRRIFLSDSPVGIPFTFYGNLRYFYSRSSMASADCTLIDASNVQDFMDSFDTVFTDCDGVLWNDMDPISGAPETVRMLKEMGKRVFYVTNNSSKSREEYTKKCAKMGIPAETEDIIGSAYVTAQYIKHVLKYEGKVYMIGSEGLKQELDNAGIPNIGCGVDMTDLRNMSLLDMAKRPLDPEVRCVVVAFDVHFGFSKLLTATGYIGDSPHCHLVATNTDSGLPFGDLGRMVPGTGAIVAAVEVASGRKSTVCGKPSKTMFEVAHAKHNINPERTIMVGDRCNTDIAWGHNCGLRTLLVLSGFSTLDEVEKYKTSEVPDDHKHVPHYYVPQLSTIRELLQQRK